MGKLPCPCGFVINLVHSPLEGECMFYDLRQQDALVGQATEMALRTPPGDVKRLAENISDGLCGLSGHSNECPKCGRWFVPFDEDGGRYTRFRPEGVRVRREEERLVCPCSHVFDLTVWPAEGEYFLTPEPRWWDMVDQMFATARRVGLEDKARLEQALGETLRNAGGRMYRCPACSRLLISFDRKEAQSYVLEL